MQYRRCILPGGTFFFTVVTHERFPYFRDETAIELMEDAIRYVQKRHPFTVLAFVYLPDHLHMLWQLPEGDSDYPTRWSLIKSYFSRKFPNRPLVTSQSRQSKGEQGIWQRRYWEHTCCDQQDIEHHLDYIHYNPVKHGYVIKPNLWKYSSLNRFVSEGLCSLDWAVEIPVRLDIDMEGE